MRSNTIYENKKIGTRVYKKDKYVVKSFPKSLSHLYRNEIKINMFVSHRHIVKFHYSNYSEKGDMMLLWFDYAPHGDLFQYIHKRKGLKIAVSEAVTYVILPLVSAVYYLHINDIVHMDIKPENVLFGDRMHLYLCDFGLSCNINTCKSKYHTIGTMDYATPEQLKGTTTDLKKVDIWCMGMLIYEMFHKKVPYNLDKCKNIGELYEKYKSVTLKSTKNIQLDTLLHLMLKFDPNERADICQVMKLVSAIHGTSFQC